MKTILKNASVVNVFTEEVAKSDVLINDGMIAGVGDYSDYPADKTIDLTGKYVCPGFIDAHIHIESTMLTPSEFAKVCVPHGTTAVVADPHEIANVCGKEGIRYMLESSEDLPLTVYIMLPSCVPATSFDESGAVLSAQDLEEFYSHPRVLGLAEVMDYPGVISENENVIGKIRSAKSHNAVINGHAPLLSGRDLDKYISSGIYDDHECSSVEEAMERIRKGQMIMIRQGSAAKNLVDLLPLFEKPWSDRCMLVSDDKHPEDLVNRGHIDDAIRIAVKRGRSPVTAIKMATLNAARYFGLKNLGAIAPGYSADILILDDLDSVKVRDVYKNGIPVAEDGRILPFETPKVNVELEKTVRSTFNLNDLSESDFIINCSQKRRCNVINAFRRQIITEKTVEEIDFSKNNGVDIEKDILKIAVIERHKHTGHIAVAFIKGIGLKAGAIASSVAHDSHNLIVVGTNEKDMTVAANTVIASGGGLVAVKDGCVIGEIPLPVAGIMSDCDAAACAAMSASVNRAALSLGCPEGSEPFMRMSFISLPVIPHIKLTTFGLFDGDSFSLIPLFAD
jgi:adenine deaminase